jgi:hypothetical protein
VSPEAETVVRGRERPTQKERGRERQRQMDRHGERQRGEAYRVRKQMQDHRGDPQTEKQKQKKKRMRERERESVTTDGHRRETEISGSQSSRNDEPTGRNFLHV